TLVRRDNPSEGKKRTLDREDVNHLVEETLEDVQVNLYETLKKYRDEHIHEAESYEEILQLIGRERGYVKAPWCGRESCEAEVKDEIHAEIVMVPFEEDREEVTGDCAVCGDEAVEIAYFAKNY
ncbi:MAG: proline--tRNA ligase, partial [Candidatus Nanohaloarchaea archaeon]|nr:proline--tRNA ligase [Candidatus Nanohaloarchaea archaeon]